MRLSNLFPIALLIIPFIFVSDAPAGNESPNVILIMTDDQGYGDFSCHGNPVIKTPNMDKLYAESVRFTDFHVAPMCSPTRGQLLTGLDAMKNGATAVCQGRSMVRTDIPTMADFFLASGYATGHFGKWHLGDSYPHRPQDRGFQETLHHRAWGITSLADYWQNNYFDPVLEHNGVDKKFKGYCTDIFFNQAMKWMDKCLKKDQPFFLYLPTNTPHVPNVVAEKYSKPYRGKYKGKVIPHAFYGMIANIDENLGKLEAFLKKRNIRDNTILIYLTDNGTQSSEAQRIFNAGMRDKKTSVYEGGHRVPCFVRWPAGKLKHGRDVAELTQVQDLLPTLIELCGLKTKNPQFDGTSLAGLLRGTQEKLPDRKLVVQYGVSGKKWNSGVVMWNKWRLIGPNKLYNLAQDPHQDNNVADQNPKILQLLTKHYDNWYAKAKPLFDRPRWITVGSEKANLIMLYGQDWVGGYCDNRGNLLRATATGYWNVIVDRDGIYELELRRWPVEANLALSAGIGGKKKLGARPVFAAKVNIAGDSYWLDTHPKKATHATFRIKLKTGKEKLETWFYDKNSRILCSAIYVKLTRLSGKAKLTPKMLKKGSSPGKTADSISQALFQKISVENIEEEDILIADFENETYGKWKVTGKAFGPGPAKGTLPRQMPVSGYKGKRLVNSFYKGDGTTGTLTSPPLKVERDYLTFLIGGGGHKGKTCMNLLLDGETVRTAAGPNVRSGGSEELQPHYWDVRKLRGKTVTIQIVDAAIGGWGHINIDHIVQSNQKPKLPEYRPFEKKFVVEKKYLIIPIKNGAKKTELTLEISGKPVRRYGTELATNPDNVDWYAFFTIGSYKDKPARVIANRATEKGFDLVRQADNVPGSEKWYSEDLRPQFHFSQKVGWNNDPNGMVYLDGEWHLFFQHNPVGWRWGNMTWGHAVSKDLVHWKQLPNALFPGTMARGACFSGGATVDSKNTSGWKTGDNDLLVAFLTDTGAGEAVAYSNDKGRTFTWYKGNPVVKHSGRDPKVIWYEYDKSDTPLNETSKKLGGHWVMAVYDQHPKFKRNIAFYTSTNLKEWQKRSHLPGYYECPEIFNLPVDGKKDDDRWVVFAANARYAVGKFDGRTFSPEHKGTHQVYYGPYYASQLFANAPEGRKIQIGWVRLNMPGMPFNQTFSFPHELTLRSTDKGIRLFAKPVEEIQQIHKKKHTAKSQKLDGKSPVDVEVSGELFDIRATFELGDAKKVGLNIGGNVIAYDVAGKKLNGAPMLPNGGRVSMQVLVDRPMIEVCGNEGEVYITSGRKQKGNVKEVRAFAEGPGARIVNLEVNELRSIWKK